MADVPPPPPPSDDIPPPPPSEDEPPVPAPQIIVPPPPPDLDSKETLTTASASEQAPVNTLIKSESELQAFAMKQLVHVLGRSVKTPPEMPPPPPPPPEEDYSSDEDSQPPPDLNPELMTHISVRGMNKDAYDDDDDEEDEEDADELSSGDESDGEHVFTHHVVKLTKYGVKQPRQAVLDGNDGCMRLLTSARTLKSETPLDAITSVDVSGSKIVMNFRGRKRVYDLLFPSEAKAKEFQTDFNRVLQISNRPVKTDGEQDNLSEYHVRKKNRMGRVQDRLFVIKPNKTLNLLDMKHKFKKSFRLDDIASIEIKEQAKKGAKTGRLSTSLSMGGAFQNSRPLTGRTSRATVCGPVTPEVQHLRTPSELVHTLEMDPDCFEHAVPLAANFSDDEDSFKTTSPAPAPTTPEVQIPDRRQSLDSRNKSLSSSSLVTEQAFTDDGGAMCFINFNKAVKQRPFQVFFPGVFDRMHFCSEVYAMAKNVLIKDENTINSKKEQYRFTVNKTNKVLRIEKDLTSNTRVSVFFKSRTLWLDFVDVESRHKFLAISRTVLDNCFSEKYLKEGTSREGISGTSFKSCYKKQLQESKHDLQDGVSIFTGTWNLGNSETSIVEESISTFLPSRKHDIYVVGLQECTKAKRDQWVSLIEMQIEGNYFGGFDSSGKSKRNKKSVYVQVGQVRLWEIVIVVYVHRELYHKVTHVEAHTVATGVGDVLGNKGGACVGFHYEDTSLAFFCCHLAARASRVPQRRENFLKIVKGTRMGAKETDLLNDYDHVFWFGDLNYRTEHPFQETVQLAKEGKFTEIFTHDQLKKEMEKKAVYNGFREGPITFCPTYRWERKEQVFSNKKEQSPSFTDRVLTHSLASGLHQMEYNSAPSCLGSDHRPVFSVHVLSPRCFKYEPDFQHGGYEVAFSEFTLISNDINHAQQLSLHLTCPVCDGWSLTSAAPWSSGKNGWCWAPTVSARLRSYLRDLKLLWSSYARFMINCEVDPSHHSVDTTKVLPCYACINLGSIGELNTKIPFSADVTKDGVLLGTLSGIAIVKEAFA